MYNFVLINNVYCFEIIKKLLLIISPHHTWYLLLLVEKIIPVYKETTLEHQKSE